MLRVLIAVLFASPAWAGELSDSFSEWQGKSPDAWHGQFMTLEVEGDGALKAWRPCEDSTSGMFQFFDLDDLQASLRGSQGGSAVLPNVAAALGLTQKLGITRILVKRDDQLDIYDLKVGQTPVTQALKGESNCHLWLKENISFNGVVLAVRKGKLLVGTTAEPLNIAKQAAVYKEAAPGKLEVISLLQSTEVETSLALFEFTIADASKTSQIKPGSPVLIE